MGGCVNPPKLGWSWEGENNLNCDPEAARIVFESGLPLLMVGLDVTLECWLEEDKIALLKSIDTPLMRGIGSMLHRWLKEIKDTKTCLHDPLTVGVAIDRTLVSTQKMHIALKIERGILRTVPYPGKKPNVEVCIQVDSGRFLNLFMERVCSSKG